MRLFEQFGASEFVLKAADAALGVTEEDDPSLVSVALDVRAHTRVYPHPSLSLAFFTAANHLVQYIQNTTWS